MRKILSQISAERILVETDASYLTPIPEKNHTRCNEPAFVKFVLLKLAEVRHEDRDHLGKYEPTV